MPYFRTGNYDSYREYLSTCGYPTELESTDESTGEEREPNDAELQLPVFDMRFTDYGGDFLDRVLSEYVQEYWPAGTYQAIPVSYNGTNLLAIGRHDTERYALSTPELAYYGDDGTIEYREPGPDFEEYYYLKKSEAERTSFEYFLDLEIGTKRCRRLKAWALEVLMSERSGYYCPQPDGTVDFCYSNLSTWLRNQTRREA